MATYTINQNTVHAGLYSRIIMYNILGKFLTIDHVNI